MEMINSIDTFIAPIVWFITMSQRAYQTLTSPRAQQVYKAIVLFIGVLCIAIVLGIAKTIQISFLEILIVQESEHISQEPIEILTAQETEPIVPNLRVLHSARLPQQKEFPMQVE